MPNIVAVLCVFTGSFLLQVTAGYFLWLAGILTYMNGELWISYNKTTDDGFGYTTVGYGCDMDPVLFLMFLVSTVISIVSWPALTSIPTK